MKFDFIPLGGGREIGANSYLLKWGKYQILLDCGLNPRKSGFEKLPLFQYIDPDKPIDMVFISHSHNDHVGALPVLYKEYEVRNIVMAEGNRDVMNLMLSDTGKVMKIRDRKGWSFYEQYYKYEEISELINSKKIKEIDYLEWNKLDGDIEYMLFPNGHVIGSSGIILRDTDGFTVVYTGDYILSGTRVPDSFEFPDEIRKVDVLITESTYGDKPDYVDRKKEEIRLINEITKTLEEDGKVLLPVFALGKAQEILVLLLKNYDEFRTNPRIRLVGLGKRITDLIDRERLAEFSSYKNREVILEMFAEWDERFDEIPENSIVLATSGMMELHTPSYKFLPQLLEDEKNLIAFTGYLSPSSFGKELLTTPTNQYLQYLRLERIGDQEDTEKTEDFLLKKAKVYHFPLSLHGNFDEIMSFIKKLKPRHTIIVHGDKDATDYLRLNLLKEGITKAFSPENGNRLSLYKDSIVSSKKRKHYIITMGTSLLSNARRYYKDNSLSDEETLYSYILLKEMEASAEVNTLLRVVGIEEDLEKENVEFYLISSDTEEADICSRVLKRYIVEHYEIEEDYVHIRIVKGLSHDVNEFEEWGIVNYINTIAEILEEGGSDSVILSTGGFKTMIAYATLLGILYKRKVYYIHETFENVVSLPAIPIDFNLDLIANHYNAIMTAINTLDFRKADRIVNSVLPDSLRPLLKMDKTLRRYILSPLGHVFVRFYKYKMSLEPGEIMIECEYKKSLWDKDITSIDDIPDPKVRRIFNRVLKISENVVEKIVLGDMKTAGKPPKEPFLEFYKIKKDSAAIYWLRTPVGAQQVVFITSPGSAENLVEMIGRKIYP